MGTGDAEWVDTDKDKLEEVQGASIWVSVPKQPLKQGDEWRLALDLQKKKLNPTFFFFQISLATLHIIQFALFHLIFKLVLCNTILIACFDCIQPLQQRHF